MGVDELRGTVRGTVFLPGDLGFDQAARPWNVAVTQSVGAVVAVADADDIAAVVRWARRAGRPVVTQPTGHGATGDIDNAVLLRTGALDSIAIDPARRLARVGSGAQWGRVQAAAAAHGLSGLAGSNPVVGVTGFGDPADGRALTRGLDALPGALVDTRAAMTADQLGTITAEPTDPSPSLSRGELLTDLGDAVVKTLVDAPVAPLLTIQIRGLGGALAESGPHDGARGPVTEPYALYLLGLGLPHLVDDVTAGFATILDELGPHITGAKPYTFLAPGESASAAFDTATLARLRQLKQDRDPHRVLRANFPVLE